jgi:hypothetical protein
MGGPGASHLGTWDSTDLGSPVLLLLDICCDSLYSVDRCRLVAPVSVTLPNQTEGAGAEGRVPHPFAYLAKG